MGTNKLISVFMLLLLLGGCFWPSGPGEPVKYQQYFIDVMNTVVDITFFAPISEAEAGEIFDAASKEMKRLEGILSAHLPGSDVKKISDNAGIAPVTVHPETLAVLTTALELGELTQGAFDVTLAPVLKLYNFSEGNRKKPTDEQLAHALTFVDWRRVAIDHEQGTVYLPEPGMQLDLGGIAKGYIVDRVAELLEQKDIKHAVVNAGGDIYISDVKADGSLWRIGITDPVLLQPNNFAVVEMGRGALVTSGDYERYFFAEGVRIHHIIDPASGLPANNSRSVTVLAPNAKLADLWSTALFVLDPEEGLALAETMPGIEALIWDADNQILYTSGMEAIMTLRD